MQGWGGSCRGGVGHVGVGWVKQGWGGVKCEFIFLIHIQPFTNDSYTRNNNLFGFKNSQMDMRGCV